MEIMKSAKAIAVVTTALFLASLLWLMNTSRVNSSLETGLKSEKLKSEQLLSEKLLLEKDIQKAKEQLSTLKGQNQQLDNFVKSTTAKLNAQESEFNKLKKDNASLQQMRKQRQELVALQNQIQNELNSLKSSNADLLAKNKELNNTVASLEERNKMLVDDLNKAMFASVDQSQIQAVKGKHQILTVHARKTKKLVAEFEVPANLKNLTFKVIDPNGNAVTQKDGTIASTTAPSDNSLIASNDASIKGNRLQKVNMVYTPNEKLKPGIYTVEIQNENLYVSSLKIKLR